jgi:PilZ domain
MREMRFDCQLAAILSFASTEFPVTIVNISLGGLSFHKTAHVNLPIGLNVGIASSELGMLYGVVKWGSNSRFGVELRPNSAKSARLTTFIDSYVKANEN